MRAMFGLVSLLVVVLIVVWLFSTYTSSISGPASSAREDAAQIAGQDLETGGPASASASLNLVNIGGKPDSVLVTSIVPGGAYERFYGLKTDDTIITIGPLPVKGHPSISSTDDAESFLMDAYQRKQPIVVVRDGQQITLPQEQKRDESAAPSDGGSKSTDPLQQQIDSIGGRRGL